MACPPWRSCRASSPVSRTASRVHPGVRRDRDGRTTFLPALGAPDWPWPSLQVYVLTSRPLPANTPDDVIVVRDRPAALVERLRSRGSDGDVHLVGGPRTIRAFYELGALDRLEIVILPILLGRGGPPPPPPAEPRPPRVLLADR